MKKVIIAFMLAACMAFSAFAQEESSKSTKKIWDHGDNVSDMTYVNVPIFKILDHPDAYIVYYEKQGLDIGQTSIPKTWFKGGLEQKLNFRNKPAGMTSYMTVFYKGNEFYKVLLTINPSRLDPVWGIAPSGTDAGVSADTTTLDAKF